MARSFEDSPQGRRGYTQFSQVDRRTSGGYGAATQARGESLKSKFANSSPGRSSTPTGSSSGKAVSSTAPKPTEVKVDKETKTNKKISNDDASQAEKIVREASPKDGKYSDKEMQAARDVRTKRGERTSTAAGGKSFGSTGGNSEETAKLDDSITLMAKGDSGKDDKKPDPPKKAESQGGTSVSSNTRSEVSSSVRSTPSRPTGASVRRDSPVKGSSSTARHTMRETEDPAKTAERMQREAARAATGSVGVAANVLPKSSLDPKKRKPQNLQPGGRPGNQFPIGPAPDKPLGGPGAQIGPRTPHPGQMNDPGYGIGKAPIDPLTGAGIAAGVLGIGGLGKGGAAAVPRRAPVAKAKPATPAKPPATPAKPRVSTQPNNRVSSQPSNRVSTQPNNRVSSQPNNRVSSQPNNRASSAPSNRVSARPNNRVSSKKGRR